MKQQIHRGVQRVRHELHIRDVNVARITPCADSFVRITFHGEALARFVSASFDDHVKFIFENAKGEQVRRDFTPLDYDLEARELSLEFALHETGDASNWARTAVIGQPAIIAGPRGSMIIPHEYDWHLLAGDRSALPAIRRRLAELPTGSRVCAVIAASGAERAQLDSQAQVDLRWVDNDAGLLAELGKLALPEGEGFAWFAGEAATAKEVRSLLIEEKGLPKEAMRVSAYWKQGVSAHHDHLD